MKVKVFVVGASLLMSHHTLIAQGAKSKSIPEPSVAIGSQEWMVNDLNVSHFRNGDTIPEIEDEQLWKAAGEKGTAAWCLYVETEFPKRNYHKLYNWFAVNDQRGLAPVGWHVPTDSEWTVLTTFLGLLNEAGGKMKSTSGWAYNQNGSNTSGFTGLPGGIRLDDGPFRELGRSGFWWTYSGTDDRAAIRDLTYSDNHVNSGWLPRGSGCFVRCVKD